MEQLPGLHSWSSRWRGRWLVGLSRCPFHSQLYLRICHFHGSSSRHRDRRSKDRRNESRWCRLKPETTPLAKLVPYAYTLRMVCWCLGSGDGSVEEERPRDQTVSGSSPGRSVGIIFFSGVNFLCWFLFRYLFHPRVTAIAREWSRSFYQKCKGQFTAKHTCILRMLLRIKWHCKLVHVCMVYTVPAPRRQQFHVAPANKKNAL